MKRAPEVLGMCIYMLVVIPALIFVLALGGCAPEGHISTTVQWEDMP